MLGIAPWGSFTLPCSPSLVSIAIRVSVSSDNPMQRMVVDLTPSATGSYENVASLSRLVVPDCMKWGLPDRYESLSLPNLTELRFGAPLICNEDVDIVLALLSICRNLQILYIDGEMSVSSFAATAPLQSGSAPSTVVLPCLVDLELTSPENHIFHLIERIDCPSLLQFSYRSPRNVQPQHFQSLTSFFSRNTLASGPPLVRLSLDYPDTSGSIPDDTHPLHVLALTQLLRLLPHLEELQLHGVIVNDQLIDQLTMHPNSGTTVLCQSLSTVTFTNYGNTGLSMAAVEEMLVSRARSGKALDAIRIRAPAFGSGTEFSERLKGLEEGGLVINF